MSADEPKPTYEELERRLTAANHRIATLEQTIERLQRRIEELERAGKRQAAPFSRGEPKPNPKPPGQKPGHEAFCRPVPKASEVTRRVRAVLPNGGRCPDCDVRLGQRHTARQFLWDIPDIRIEVTEITVEVGICGRCGRRVQGHHPDQISDALGIAGLQIGPRLLSMAMDLKYRLGMPWNKVAGFFGAVFDVGFTPSALCRAAQRVAESLRMTEEALLDAARRSRKANLDETGWRISGRPAWLWDIITRSVSLYRIRQSRGADVPLEVLTPNYRGRIHSDGARAYQSEEILAPKQTCLRHLETDLQELVETQRGVAGRFPRACLGALRTAHALHKRRRSMSRRGFRVARSRVENQVEDLLRIWRPQGQLFRNADNRRMFRRLQRHHQKNQLLAFLHDPCAEPTNNLAEREIRPAVVFRKISAGNRSWRGARTFEVLTSVLRTAVRRGLKPIQVLLDAIRSPEPKCVIPGLALDSS